MSRPSLASRPTRDVTNVVADMLGDPHDRKTAVKSDLPPKVSKQKPPDSKTEKSIAVNTADTTREKTSFAIRPEVKRHLTLLKLDLRAAGHRVTEAQIVETLIAQASADNLATMLGLAPRRARRSE
jgi:hypothetical protein